jgi:tryptophan synthase alpha chain
MGKLGIYLVANFPAKESFLEAVRTCEESGVDFLEVGFPFSDPVADGDVIEKAALESLRRYTSDDFFESIRRARAIFSRKLYIMTYSNIIYSTGIARFVRRAGPFDGLILADLPLREIQLFEKRLQGRPVTLIRFLTPESRPEDIARALKGANDFVYFVSKRGTTGGDFQLGDETRQEIARVRGNGVDVYLGFGIQDRQDVAAAWTVADGAIIGTKAVSELDRGTDQFRRFLATLKVEQ